MLNNASIRVIMEYQELQEIREREVKRVLEEKLGSLVLLALPDSRGLKVPQEI